MIYFGFALAISILGGMIYMSIDKKTEPAARLASIIALGVMVLTVIICLFIALTDKSVPFDESVLIVGAPPETKKDDGNNIMMLLLLVILIVALYAVILFLSLKERKKNMPNKNVETKAAEKFEL
ncbi:MAG: hypothetical protein FWF68_08200 [Spirochaetes bacterium]|nr:hypothetical protein [Spirochaetota bacterium]